MRKKILKLRKIWKMEQWALGALAAAMIPFALLERDSGPYFFGLVIVCLALMIALWIFQAVLARKLLRCPYCLRYSPPAAEAFMRGKEETFRCPHCGKEIPATKE